MAGRKTTSRTGRDSSEPPRFSRQALVMELYAWMLEASGPRQWWPCDRSGVRSGRDEIIIGAILTQNTAWTNVEKALECLKAQSLCNLSHLALLDPEDFAPLIRSSGYYHLKARRLKAMAEFFAPGGVPRFDELAHWDPDSLRQALLDVYGAGPETADSILLYALERPTFVIDAYTLRIARRHGLLGEKATYDEAREFFLENTPASLPCYNEYHALLVWIGNRYCKPQPRCAECPLNRREGFAGEKAWRALADFRQAI